MAESVLKYNRNLRNSVNENELNESLSNRENLKITIVLHRVKYLKSYKAKLSSCKKKCLDN